MMGTMTGPEHYREAERLLRSRTRYFNGGQTRQEDPPSADQIAQAQVHATLALAAAMAGVGATVTLQAQG